MYFRFMTLLLGLCLAGCAAPTPTPSPPAPDPRLVALRELLLPLRAHTGDSADEKIVGTLVEANHRLREWIEARIASLDPAADRAAFAAGMNAELLHADLTCGPDEYAPHSRCANGDSWYDATGFVGRVSVDPAGLGTELVVKTLLGVECGYGESAYLYDWKAPGWRLAWQDEAGPGGRGQIYPRAIDGVHISAASEPSGADRLVFSAGNDDWCASNWHDVFWRLWRIPQSGAAPVKLVDETHSAFRGGLSSFIDSSLGQGDALVEFETESLDLGRFAYTAVRHYKITDNVAARTHPIALTPRNFVEEWLAEPWETARGWSAPDHLPALERFHRPRSKDDILSTFVEPTRHCPRSVDRWQVGIEYQGSKSDDVVASAYYLIRWRPPYRFQMIDARSTPFRECTEPDPEADAEQTLFPDTE